MEKNVRILIVEDEFVTMDLLRDYLEESGYEVSGDAMSADEAIAILEKGDTDIAMLDINLKGNKDGIWVAEQIRQKYRIPFIFLSAYSDSATISRAAEVRPYGYLVKPFTKADVFTAIEIALKNFAHESQTAIAAPAQNWSDDADLLINQSIFVKDNTVFKKIMIADIQYVQAYKNYLELHLNGTQRIVIRSTLQKFLTILTPKYFVQIHRSFVVNVKFVEEIQANDVIIAKQSIPLSKNYKEEFLNKFNFFV